MSENRNELPLQVQLHLDSTQPIFDFSLREVALLKPSPSTILSFRGVLSTPRFDEFTFREGNIEDDDCPSEEQFRKIRELAVDLEDERDNETVKAASSASESDSEGEGGRRAGKKGKANGETKGKGRGKPKASRRRKSSSPETVPSSMSSAPAKSDSDDELLRDEDPSTKYDFPQYVIAFSQHTWWPATLTGYYSDEGKFVVEVGPQPGGLAEQRVRRLGGEQHRQRPGAPQDGPR